MRAVLAWIDKVQDDEGQEHSVYDVDYKPDGSELLVAADSRVLVYDGHEGHLLTALKGHKDTVYCVAFSHNGERFASGSADKSVIIWTEQHEGILKYSHSDALQALRFNPKSLLLLSAAASDFGLWTPSQKSVNKNRPAARICSASWSRDGALFAIGLANGTVSIRNQAGEERGKVERDHSEPVWTLAFNPNKLDEPFGASAAGSRSEPSEPSDPDASASFASASHVLAVGDWNQKLTFYNSDGQRVGREQSLDYDPCSLDFFTLGDFLVMGGSNRQLNLHTKEGTKLGLICELDSWIWACKTKPGSQFVAVGCQDGTLACYQLMFSTVHGLHKDRYAYRENMTDVVVQDLNRDVKVRLHCRDLVKKVAVYQNRLAIQLPDRVNIYRQVGGDAEGEPLDYRILERINESFECSLLVICAQNLILCQEKRLQCYDFRGLKSREWSLDALIRYIKVVGGMPGREAILVGLKNGQVLKIFMDNPFPVELLQLKCAVRCLDVSLSREKLAIVDEQGLVQVYHIPTKHLMYQEPNANSVAWNTDHEELLCFSGNNVLSIKVGEFPAYQQKLQGFVVGFSGKRVFCLHLYAMTTQEVPLSNQLYQYLEKGAFEDAYALACLGATEADWEILAMEALTSLQLTTAKAAFHRVRNTRYLDLISDIQERRERGESNDKVFLGDIAAYQGHFKESARLYKEAGEEQRALDMFTDLRMFDAAQELLASASGETQKSLIRKRADWAANSNDPRTAAEMYVSAGDYDKAIKIIIANGWTDMLMGVVRKMEPRGRPELLLSVAKHLEGLKEWTLAAEVFRLSGDLKALVAMHVGAEQWEDAFAIVAQQPDLRDLVYLPYARWLAERDRFEEAQKAYHKAGREEEALGVLEALTGNAVSESRFKDAAYYHWMLSLQYLERASEAAEEEKEYALRFFDSQSLADVYYAYDAVHRYLAEPFTSFQPDALLNISRFLLHEIGNTQPIRVSKVSTLYTMAKQAKALGGYKLARHAFERLQRLKCPARFQSVIDLGALQIRAKPFSDAEELLPMCYRCSTPNPLLNSQGNSCLHCKAPFIFSFASFEVLPVVEFSIGDIPEAEARSLIEAEPPLNAEDADSKPDPFNARVVVEEGGRYRPVAVERADLLKLARSEVIVCDWAKPLRARFYRNVIPEISVSKYRPVAVERADLLKLARSEVIVCDWAKPLRARFYRNVIPEISVSKCSFCNRLFHTDDYELALLSEGHCPFCRRADPERKKAKAKAAHDSDDDEQD